MKESRYFLLNLWRFHVTVSFDDPLVKFLDLGKSEAYFKNKYTLCKIFVKINKKDQRILLLFNTFFTQSLDH